MSLDRIVCIICLPFFQVKLHVLFLCGGPVLSCPVRDGTVQPANVLINLVCVCVYLSSLLTSTYHVVFPMKSAN